MRFVKRMLSRRAAAMAAAALAAACATITAQAPEGTASIVRIERASWNAEPEQGLFRVTLDERRARQVLVRAGIAQVTGSQDTYFIETDGLEEEAGRELKAKGLCGTSAKLITPAERTAAGGITGIFKCRPAVF